MPRLDAEHRGPLVNIAAWFLLVTMILFVASKVVTKWRMVRRLQNDDYLFVTAMLTATAQCIAASQQAEHGLGQVQTSLSANDLDIYQKASYTDDFFYVITIYLSKLAALQFLIILARPGELTLRRTAVKGTLGLVSVWLVIAVVCIAFQCKVPTPWNEISGQCFNQLAFWSANAAVDIASTLMIGLMPIYLLSNLQLPRRNKRLAMLSFTPNLTTVPLTTLRLIYLIRAFHSPDQTKASFTTELVTVIHTNYSIISSCLPFLKPFLDSLAIGAITNDIRIPLDAITITTTKPPPKKPTTTAAGPTTTTTAKMTMTNPFAILTSGSRYASKRATVYGPGWTRSIIQPISNIGIGGGGGGGQEHEMRDLERYGSRERMVINQTRTAEVTVEAADQDDEEERRRRGGVGMGVAVPSSVMISAGGPIPKAGFGP